MTDKRFVISSDSNQNIYDTKEKCYYSSIDAMKLCDLLNGLYKENEQLKNKYEKLKRSGASLGIENDGLIYENYELQKENDELKKQITSLKVELDTHKHSLGSTREAERKVSELTDLLSDETKKDVMLLNSLRKENMGLKDVMLLNSLRKENMRLKDVQKYE